MAVLATTHPTLADLANLTGVDGKVLPVISILSQENEIMEDAVWIEGNLPTGHQSVLDWSLPSPTWRKLNAGVQPAYGKDIKVVDTCGMMASYSEVDRTLCDLNGNTAAFRLSKDRKVIEGMNQEFASTLFYGDEGVAPEEFSGFAPRYNNQSLENGGNILTSAATPDATDNTSIWLVGWGPDTVHCIYPKGMPAGLRVEDKGAVTIESIDGAGGRMEAYRTYYEWHCGLAVPDWRYIVRINFDLEDTIAAGTSGPVLYNLMSSALRRIPNLNRVRPAFYANRETLDLLDQQAMNKGNMAFRTVEDAQGKVINKFRGVPVRRCDAILNTEAGI